MALDESTPDVASEPLFNVSGTDSDV